MNSSQFPAMMSAVTQSAPIARGRESWTSAGPSRPATASAMIIVGSAQSARWATTSSGPAGSSSLK